MPKLTRSIRLAASSILLLSVTHIFFWFVLAVASNSNLPATYPYNWFFPVALAFSAAGVPGVVIAVGIFRGRNWARVAALVLAALVGLFCAFAILGVAAILLGLLGAGLGVEIPTDTKTYLTRFAAIYLSIFWLAVWWIFVFSRKSAAVQFSQSQPVAAVSAGKKPACPTPIALLAWLMIASSALSALSWSLFLGRIPAMLFTHIFSPAPSKGIWIANILLFVACGVGLLRLQRWSYTGTIALHGFWLVSLFVSQLSPNYESYTRLCLDTLQLADTYPILNRLHSPQWISATMTAIPTALLIGGLFYYRRSFLQAVSNSRRLPA